MNPVVVCLTGAANFPAELGGNTAGSHSQTLFEDVCSKNIAGQFCQLPNRQHDTTELQLAAGGLERDPMAQQRRRRVKHEATFEERLAAEALKFRDAAEKQPNGSHARELLLRRARQPLTKSGPWDSSGAVTVCSARPLDNARWPLKNPES
jgi:hypothetical protein